MRIKYKLNVNSLLSEMIWKLNVELKYNCKKLGYSLKIIECYTPRVLQTLKAVIFNITNFGSASPFRIFWFLRWHGILVPSLWCAAEMECPAKCGFHSAKSSSI